MKLRHTIKRLNQSRRMYRRLFREAAHNVHPNSRQDRNQLVATAYATTEGNTNHHRRLIKSGTMKLRPSFNSMRSLFSNKPLHASKESKFEINPDGLVMVTHVLNHQRKPWIGMLVQIPERPKNWKPTVTSPNRQGNIPSLTPPPPSPNPTPVL